MTLLTQESFLYQETFYGLFFCNNVFAKRKYNQRYIKQCPDSNIVDWQGKRNTLTKQNNNNSNNNNKKILS